MNPDDERMFLKQVQQHLEQHAEAVDELTAARLRAARKQALDRSPRRGLRWLPATGLASAAAALLAVLVWQQGDSELPVSADDWAMLAAGDELELIEDWEFYAWLDALETNG